MSPGFEASADRVLHAGSVITLVEREIAAPDGQVFTREVVRHPGAVSIVAVDEHGRAVLVRQYRAPVDGRLLEIPAGKRDVDDEPPETTARRELIEEVGLEARSLELLARFYNSPGFCDEYSFVFLARDLRPVPADAQGPEERYLEVERVALDDVPALIAGGDLTDAKSIIGLLLARDHLLA